MADLTAEQLRFVQKHLGYDTKGYFAKKAIKSQIEEFWRRREKAQSEIRDLPPDHPQRANLQQEIDAATAKAEGGDLKGAYKDLKSTKDNARAAAKQVRDGVNLGAVNADLNALENDVRRMSFDRDRISALADTQSQDVLDAVARMGDPASGRDREDTMRIVADNYRDREQIMSDWDAMEANLRQLVQTYKTQLTTTPTILAQLTAVSHSIGLYNKQNPGNSSGTHNARYTGLDARARNFKLTGNGADLETEVNQLLRTRRDALLNALKPKVTSPTLSPAAFTDNDGKALTGQDAEKMSKEMEERFRHIEKREKERLEAAKRAMQEAMITDSAFLRQTEDTSPVTSRQQRPFYTDEMFEEAEIDVTDTRKRPDEIAASAAQALDQAIDRLMAQAGGFVPDEVFDLTTRSPHDWYREAAKAAGIVFDPAHPETIDPTVWAKIKAAGDAMRNTAIDKYPDKAKCDDKGKLTEATVGGVTYSEIKMLGSGGGGVVYKATDPVTGHQIVLKTPKGYHAGEPSSEDTIETMRSEAANHRAVSGGESDPCHQNILDMKGIVLAPNGDPLIAMDLADAGDANDYTEAMGACEHSGMISEPARQAMMAAQMRDIMKGMKAMQAQGMTHFDLKELNIFLTSDGTFKVADFGLAQHVDGHDGKAKRIDEYTPGYESPEQNGEGSLSQKSDNFTLGEILERITDPKRQRGKFKESFSSQNPTSDRRRDQDGKVGTASALDRVINSLKDPDPDKRPTIDSVLLSSYFSELDASHTPEDVDRLKKASAEYAKSIGRETADLNREITYLEGEIQQLEMGKTDALARDQIELAQRFIAEQEARIRRLTRELALEWEKKPREAIERSISNSESSIEGANRRIATAQAKLGQTKSALEIEDIDKKIADKRKQIQDFTKKIGEIHAKPEYAAVVQELNEANKAFA
ncbi:protein kinase family protein [Albibacillus kandeliae]|uniref:protein kinase family protein n=1 Tax=Albibacillus kandeliae TaxID=2174228 RepID=UPI000D698556|nr:protein kinase family protein [Albibacillus kandeliae]